MSIRFNKVLSLPVISYESGDRLGEIKDLVVDHDNGKFLALVVGEGILTGSRIIRVDKVRNFGRDTVMILDSRSLEVMTPGRIQDIIQSKIKIKGNKVITESETNLGKVMDFEIDLESERLSFIFVRTKILGGPLIVSYNQIVSIGKDAIVVKDEVVKVKALEPELARA